MNSYIKIGFIGTKKSKYMEFHITPCITFVSGSEPYVRGFTIALEWGYWALMVIFANKYKEE